MAKQEPLFPEMHRARYGAGRQQRLMLPRLLTQASGDQRLIGANQTRAHAILCRWAELEKTGKLEAMNETALEGEFLSEVFGDALGYILFSENLELWNIQPKYTINGGQADAVLRILRSEGIFNQSILSFNPD